ncbi:DUF1211 domain-containing protein [Weissella muntiaci]|uniref:DUF1211 domain-containing protein n=1 Tax=Weissella muntiaci TaxID=2508881 RepID=A0A6C2C379_9LACO|nr:TMEM175 family protein [Weissella muntiaci]TYC48430.1 DUF1211 domain-containing protein [Weissella muntiaci]
MNKHRVETFTDAIIAIITTIMILEFKVPDTFKLHAIIEELPALFAYGSSFFFILVAWYNHHYLFSLANRISKRIYWINNLWIFTMSLLPVATAWVGRYINKPAPELFYFFIFFIWSITFLLLAKAIANELSKVDLNAAQKIIAMPAVSFLNSKLLTVLTFCTLVITSFFPLFLIIMTVGELIYMAVRTPADGDQLDRQ